MITPEDRKPVYCGCPVNYPSYKVCDFEICFGEHELKRAMATLNYNGYDLVTVTQTMDKYTVFFWRPPV